MTEPVDLGGFRREDRRVQKEPPLVRAQRLGIKNRFGGELIGYRIAIPECVADTVGKGFEQRTLPEPSATSYVLGGIQLSASDSNPAYLTPSYELIPPQGSDLPHVQVNSSGSITLIEGEDRRTLDHVANPHSSFSDQDLSRVLDAYEAIVQSGIATTDATAVRIHLNLGSRGGEEALTAIARYFPRTDSMIGQDMRTEALAVRERAIEAEEREKKASGIKYWRDREEQQLGLFAEELRANVNALAGYTDTQGVNVPGSLVQEPFDESLLRTIGVGFSTLDEELIRGNTHMAIYYVREFLTKGLLNLAESSRNRLLLSPPDGFSLERGTPPIEPDRLGSLRGSGTLRVEQTDQEGNIPLAVDGEFTGINIEPTDPDIHIQRVKRFKRKDAAPGDFADTLDDSPTGLTDEYELVEDSKNDFRPTFQISFTERAQSGEEETYKVWRVNDGILVQCSESDVPTYYKRDMIATGRVQVYRKPVIYLYPKKRLDVTVKLDYKGQLTNTYPLIDGDTWQVKAMPDGTLTTNGKKYKYLFWDGVNGEVDWDWSEGFCVHKDEIDGFLEEKIERLGLNFAEAQDFITYWAPMMKQNEWSLVSFQTERYESLAKLTITPTPDALIRLFMVFKKVDACVRIKKQKWSKIKRKGFTVVEWGGSNLDEVSLQQPNHNEFILSQHRMISALLQ